MSPSKDLSGQKFGRLTVIKRAPRKEGERLVWLCLCECGRRTVVPTDNLKSGNSYSCGCYNIEAIKARTTTHGHTANRKVTPTYKSWRGMIERCTSPKDKYWARYGGRGIKVCSRWLKFENFYADMGDKPKNKILDRIDNDGNYEPSNCKWSTFIESANNTSHNRFISFKGKTQTVTQWNRELGLPEGLVQCRLDEGWTDEEALIPKVFKNQFV